MQEVEWKPLPLLGLGVGGSSLGDCLISAGNLIAKERDRITFLVVSIILSLLTRRDYL